MNYTTNFNLNKPEGTDLYNHLTVDNPNMDTIDAAMQANKLASVGAATELVSGTVHAITRSNSNQNIFKFKATGDFKIGDTITVDGVSVNAYTTSGQQLLDDAYVLSAEVLCILDGTSLWVLVNKTPDASEVDYNGNPLTTFLGDLQNIKHRHINNTTVTLGSTVNHFGFYQGSIDLAAAYNIPNNKYIGFLPYSVYDSVYFDTLFYTNNGGRFIVFGTTANLGTVINGEILYID